MVINVFTDQAEQVTISVEKAAGGTTDVNFGDIRLAADTSAPFALAISDEIETVGLVLYRSPEEFPDMLGDVGPLRLKIFGKEISRTFHHTK